MSLGTRGPWKKLKAIGKGSFGTVFLVQRKPDEKKFVMKEVSLKGLPPREVAAAQHEVQVLKKINHPHIVAYEEALVVDSTLCIVMEHADGGDLGSLCAKRKKENRPFTEEEVLRIFWQLCSALSYMHADHKMLHRDLKPQNVFLTADHDVKLGDFGLAKVVEATCALAKTQCGTPVYMSPELCLGQDYNRAADVWALGCVLYELMTLTPPWADMKFNGAGGMSAFLKRIANSTLDLSPCKKRYSSELCSLLASLLHKRSVCRPALNNVLLMDIMAKAAPTESAEGQLPANWRKVPSASRPGEFSFLHVPTGFKQAAFPESDVPSAEFLEAARVARQERTGVEASPRAPLPTMEQPANRAAAAAPKPAAPPTSPNDAAERGAEASVGLPRNWRRVPSSSRPGEFSYLHVPTGMKQTDRPSGETPDPQVLAQWQKMNADAARQPPPTPMGVPASPAHDWGLAQLGGKLDPVLECSDISDRPPSAAKAKGGAAPAVKAQPAVVKAQPAVVKAPPSAPTPGRGPGLGRLFTPPHNAPQAKQPIFVAKHNQIAHRGRY